MATLKHCKALPAYSNYLVWRLFILTLFGITVSYRVLKVSEDTKNVIYSTDSCESFKFIHFRGWATKSDGFFPTFNFIHATFCRLYSWLILSVQKNDILWSQNLSFPGNLGCIVCQHYESLFVLPIFDILFKKGARWFCLSCIRRDLISSASCVRR